MQENETGERPHWCLLENTDQADLVLYMDEMDRFPAKRDFGGATRHALRGQFSMGPRARRRKEQERKPAWTDEKPTAVTG